MSNGLVDAPPVLDQSFRTGNDRRFIEEQFGEERLGDGGAAGVFSGPHHIRAFDVDAEGRKSKGRILAVAARGVALS